MARLVLTRQAETDLSRLPDSLRRAVAEALDDLAIEPSMGKALLGRLEGRRSLRVGNYRILYTIEGRSVVIRAIRHRALAYRRRRGRGAR